MLRRFLTAARRLGWRGIAVASGVLALALVLVLAVRASEGEPATAKPASAQAEEVANASALTERDADPERLAVSVLPSTAFLREVQAAPEGSLSAARLSPATGIAAAVFSGSQPQRIVAARLLPEQFPAAVEAFSRAGADVTVTSAPARSSSPYQRAPAGAVPAEPGGGPSWALIGILAALATGLSWMVFRAARRRKAEALAGAASDGRAESPSGVTPPDTRFSDVAGCDEAIEELQELVLLLREPERFARAGAVAPRGVLLEGPPGTGKTLLARAVAGEAGVPFFAAAGPDFVELYVGVGAKRVRSLFDKARATEQGAIVFIDEIDAVGRKRSTGSGTGHQETENTLNALLVEMDGFQASNVIVIGATNRSDLLDDALKRPGRLDRKIQVPLPDRRGRLRILEVHARNRPLARDVDLDVMARRSPGMSGAELAQLVNEACMCAARSGRDEVTHSDFDEALATVAMGRARMSAVVTDHDRTVTAWHEAGHTVSAMVLPDADPPVAVTIIPRGPAGGVTWMAQGDDLFLTRRRAFSRLVVAMSGRAAEELLLDGEFTSGPHGDLTSATNLAFAMVTQYGMTDAGLMVRSEGLLSTGSKITDDTVEAVEALLADALSSARETLRQHRSLLDRVVAGLLEYDTLNLAQLQALQGKETGSLNPPPAPVDYRRVAPARAQPARVAVRPRGGVSAAFAAARTAWQAGRAGERQPEAAR